MGTAHSLAPNRLFQELDNFEHIAVAVSGGSDSLALLHLLHHWALSHGKRLTAITVDHQLREASRDEAAYVGRLCKGMGVEHHVLQWFGDKPDTGLPSAARTARYALMAAHCSRSHIQVLALGHTRDDQAETLLMRLTRTDEQNRGLSGMATITLVTPNPACHVIACRPLLDIGRTELRAYLSRHNVEWVDDPSNEDQQYERVRVRAHLADEPDLAQKLIDYAAIHARYRSQMALDAARFIELHCYVSSFDCVYLQRSKLDEQPLPLAVFILQVLLSVVGGRDYLPPAMKVLDVLQRLDSSTLARVQITTHQSQLILNREVRNLPPVLRLENGPMLWDQRFWLTPNDDLSHDIEVSSGFDLKGDIADYIDADDNYLFSKITKFDKRALVSMPFGCIYDGNDKISDFIIKSEVMRKELSLSRALGAFDRYCTQFDFPIKRALERLFTVKMLKG
ncbi:MAG: tRNA lysidine(34) synthetase TilS [Hyphomicrobiales bacterium]